MLPYALYENRRTEPWAPLLRPSSVAVLPDARFLFADHGSGRVHRFDAEGFYEGGLTVEGNVRPLDLASHGMMAFVLDSGARRILRFTDRGVFRDVFLDLDDLDRSRRIDPSAMDIDRDGRIAIADVAEHRVLIAGPFLELETVVGEYGSFEGQFDEPRGVAFGLQGVLYVSDRGNRRVQAFDRTGFLLTSTVSVDDTDPQFIAPSGMAVDGYGNLFVCDAGSGEVLVFTPDLHLLLRIGSGDFEDTDLSRPVDCAVGPDDRLYVADAGRNQLVVFEILYR